MLRTNQSLLDFNSTQLLLVALILLLGAQPAIAQKKSAKDKIPLVERKPFDLIQLDDINNDVEIEIIPLKEPLSDPLPAQGFLIFDAPEISDDRLQVPYQNIVRYRTFNQLLMEDADRLIRSKRNGEAFRNLIYVYDHGGKRDTNVVNTIQKLLFSDGARNYTSGNYELAQSIFQDIYDRDPGFDPGIPGKSPLNLILECQDKNIATSFQAGNYFAVRAAMLSLELRYGDKSGEIIDRWRKLLLKQSDDLLADSRRLLGSGDGKQAHLMARRANSVLPGRREANALFQEIVEQYPIVFVGVSQHSEAGDPLSRDNWALRRIGKLTKRSVVEFIGPGDDGGKYEFLNGTIEQIDDDGYVLRFNLNSQEQLDFATPTLTVHSLVKKMLARGSVNSKDYDTQFAKVVKTIQIESETSVIVTLNKAHVLPAALFQFLYEPLGAGAEEPVSDGAYVMTEKSGQVAVFEKNPLYADLENMQHPQVVEWKFDTQSEAAQALIAGEIDVVDRVNLADLSRLQQTAGIEIGSYIVPTVHMLVPNIRNEFMEDSNFRNGLKQGINRDLILNDVICGGNEVDGCEVISGPFPIGTEENDQVSYAYNLTVPVQPPNDRLGRVLTQVIYNVKVSQQIQAGNSKPDVKFPTLVLAHPDEAVPRIASINIQQMWSAMGFKVLLKPLPPGVIYPEDDDWDFLYYEASIEEPLTDADYLFGSNGIVKSVSAPAVQNMQKLGYSDSWQVAGRLLRSIHRQIVNDVTVIPLWQIKEHFAYQENLKGTGKNPTHLYQNIERWKIEPRKEQK